MIQTILNIPPLEWLGLTLMVAVSAGLLLWVGVVTYEEIRLALWYRRRQNRQWKARCRQLDRLAGRA
jgi:hypothetical protein